MHRHPSIRTIIIYCLGLLILAAPTVAAGEAVAGASSAGQAALVDDRWYVLEFGGSPAGWMHDTVHDDGKHFISAGETELRIRRGAMELQVTTKRRFVETHAGKPVEMSMVQDTSQQVVHARWVFADDHVESVTEQAGREIRKKLPLPDGDWMTPRAIDRYWLEQRNAGAKEMTFRTLNSEVGINPITVTMVYTGDDEFEFSGKTLSVSVWETTTSLMPGITATSKMTADGRLVHDKADMGLGSIVTRLVTAEEALAAGAQPAPEMMLSLFITPDRPIDRSMEVQRVSCRLKVKTGDMPALPSAGAQRFTMDDDKTMARLDVDVNDPLPATDEERDDATLLESSTMIDASDALIGKLAMRAVRDVDDDPLARARAMHRFVYDYITAKSLDTAFASASETARTRAGDCSEHGLLLCAMLRAQGIPARVATGLVYANLGDGGRGVFGWHIWTQALIGGRWIDLDATLPVAFHAAHVLTGTTSMNEGSGMADLSTMMNLLGNLDIEVLEYEYAD